MPHSLLLGSSLGTSLLFGVTDIIRAQEDPKEFLQDKPRIGLYLEQASKYRAAAGFTPLDKPVTNVNVGLSYGKFDGFIWGALNNNSWNVNEVDAGIGYSFTQSRYVFLPNF